MADSSTVVPCPTCGKSVEWSPDAEWRPFCSKRCRLIDLGEWLDEGHRIPDTPSEDEGKSWETGSTH